jgi:protein-S-isoprenylcysteine O-methyltransferase Ste14
VVSFAIVPFIEHWIGYAWFALFILWAVAGVLSKRSVQAQTDTSRLFQAGLAFLGLMLIFNFNNWFVSVRLTTRIIPLETPYVLGGAILTLAGMAFSLWARAILGTNWSATVTIKENHTLVSRGPYQIVRHPIYTGFLLGLLGTSFVYGLARCFIGILVVGFAFWLKSQTEEQFMVQRFGQQYLDYRRQVRALIPYVL